MKELTTKNKIIELRKKGLTFQEIRKTLKINLPKSTISTWCKGVKLPKSYSNKILQINHRNLKKARVKALKTNQNKRNGYLKKLEKFWSSLTKIKPSQFYKAQIDVRTIGKKTIKLHYKGVCRIDYFNADIYNELKVIGEIITN